MYKPNNFKKEDTGYVNLDKTDISLDMYILKYYIEPSKDHPVKCPSEMMKWQSFMGTMQPLEFWIWLIEQPKKEEHKHMRGQTLVWGYADRIAYLAARFYNSPKREQDYILKARKQEQPIWWRGDCFESFRIICRESYRYSQLNEKETIDYRKQAMRLAIYANTRVLRPSADKAGERTSAGQAGTMGSDKARPSRNSQLDAGNDGSIRQVQDSRAKPVVISS